MDRVSSQVIDLSERMLTLAEVAEFLRVPELAVRAEIESGKLKAKNIGGHTRITERALKAFLDSNDGTGGTRPDNSNNTENNGGGPNGFDLRPAPDFTHTWPAKQGSVPSTEQFCDVREGVVHHGGRERKVKIGFTFRHSAGKRRRRSLVVVDRYPTVEFVAADENRDGRMASIIRDRNGKQIPVGATVPAEYQHLPVGPYSNVVTGSGASTGLAVICDADDVDTMIKHALIRYQFREERR